VWSRTAKLDAVTKISEHLSEVTRTRKGGVGADLSTVQQPLKERYRDDADASRITLVARASQAETPIACSVDLGRTIYEAQAHPGVGGAGTAACSGDLVLGALAACAQLTCQMVAAGMKIPIEDVQVTVEGDLDLRGTLGISREARVGFESVRLRFDLTAPGASDEQLAALRDKTERYCVVLATLTNPPQVETMFSSG
jgi:uncharacterized OsmC-like protein